MSKLCVSLHAATWIVGLLLCVGLGFGERVHAQGENPQARLQRERDNAIADVFWDLYASADVDDKKMQYDVVSVRRLSKEHGLYLVELQLSGIAQEELCIVGPGGEVWYVKTLTQYMRVGDIQVDHDDDVVIIEAEITTGRGNFVNRQRIKVDLSKLDKGLSEAVTQAEVKPSEVGDAVHTRRQILTGQYIQACEGLAQGRSTGEITWGLRTLRRFDYSRIPKGYIQNEIKKLVDVAEVDDRAMQLRFLSHLAAQCQMPDLVVQIFEISKDEEKYFHWYMLAMANGVKLHYSLVEGFNLDTIVKVDEVKTILRQSKMTIPESEEITKD